MSYFDADPYKHQDASSWKDERLEEDATLLCNFLNINKDELKRGSAIYKGKEENLFRFIYTVRFLDYCYNKALKPEDTTLMTVVTIFAIEAITPGGTKKEKVFNFFNKTLDNDGKILLLRSFAFSEPFLLGTTTSRPRHLMYNVCKLDCTFRANNDIEEDPHDCTVNDSPPQCHCERWLRERGTKHIDRWLELLTDKLYEMRCAVVHDADLVFLFSKANKTTRLQKDSPQDH